MNENLEALWGSMIGQARELYEAGNMEGAFAKMAHASLFTALSQIEELTARVAELENNPPPALPSQARGVGYHVAGGHLRLVRDDEAAA